MRRLPRPHRENNCPHGSSPNVLWGLSRACRPGWRDTGFENSLSPSGYSFLCLCPTLPRLVCWGDGNVWVDTRLRKMQEGAE